MGFRKPHLVKPGDTFGRLTVLAYSHNDKRHRRFYITICTCGNLATVQGTCLRSGNTRSCGCLPREAKKARALPNNQGAVNQLELGYKRHAKERGLEYCLTAAEFAFLIRQPCHYCGITGANTITNRSIPEGFRYNGIDRADSSRGYTKSNVVPCCGQCNKAKLAMSQEEFIGWAVRVATHQGRLG